MTQRVRFGGIISTTVAVLLAGGLSGGCEKNEENAMKAGAAMPGPSVTAAVAIAQDVPVYLDEIGRTAARESVTVQPQVTGKLLQLHFTDGATAQQGDLLFTIDPRPFQATLEMAKATLAQNQADVKWSQGELQRFSDVQQTGAVSKNEIEQKQNALAVAQAKVLAAEANVDQEKLNVEYCEIRAPISGRLGQRLVDPGNVVTTGGSDGGTKMLTIQAFDPIYADFTITENELGTVRKFMAQGVLPEGDPQGKLQCFVDTPGNAQAIIAALGALPTSRPADASTQPVEVTGVAGAVTTRPAATKIGPREGLLTFLDNTVQNGTGTVHVRATLPNADRYFWPGQFVHVRLVLTVKKNAVLVPTSAPQVAQVGSFVYVVKPDSTAEMRPVQLGQRQRELVVIESGVSAGERVITTGQMLVAPGAKVNVMESPAATGAGAVAEAKQGASGQ